MMVITMMLPMILMEMLALPMRCLLDTLPFVTHDKNGVVLDMRVVTLRGRVSFLMYVLGGVLFFSFEGCSEDIIYLFFSFFLRYIVLVHEVL